MRTLAYLVTLTKQKGTNGQCETQTAYCFHHANDNVTDNNGPIVQSPKSAVLILLLLLNYNLI